MHFTYTIFVNNTPIYVGSGREPRRAFDHFKKTASPVFEILNAGGLIEVHQQAFETQTEALDWEKVLIARYGREIDGSGPLKNISKGGSPGSGGKWTVEARLRQVGRKFSDETRAKMSASAKKRAPPTEEHCRAISEGRRNGGKSPVTLWRKRQSPDSSSAS